MSTGLHLRLVCAVTPLAVAGLRFGRGPVRAYGVLVQPLDQFGDVQLHELFAEPRIDVSVGLQGPSGDWLFAPVADLLDLARLVQLMTPPAETRGTADILAEHARLEAERARDNAAPGGDDEDAKDTIGAAPDALSAAADAAQPVEAPPAPAAGEGSTGAPAATPPAPPPKAKRQAAKK